MSGRKVVVSSTKGDYDMTVNEEGRGDVVQHAHPNSGTIHFEASITATSRFILIDVSDTTNYPHTETNYVHIEWLQVAVDGDNQADYEVCIGFLENVDATNGDFYGAKCFSGTKTAGRSFVQFESPYPNGWRMRTSDMATSKTSLNDTNYQTDVDLKTTLDPSTADTPSGDGDVVAVVTVSGGTLNLTVDIGYHTH
jgi:hypothetical protein